MALPRRSDVRNEERQALQGVFREIQRSANFNGEGLRIEREMKTLFDRCEKAESDRFDQVRDRLLASATVLPLDPATLRKAKSITLSFGLEDFDAVMLASVLLDLPRLAIESCFLNRNKNDFETPDIKRALGKCKFHRGFKSGLAWPNARAP
ncbi:hypothetical protein SAMN02745121_06431 [Nannocystis exedens]|uniref:PIN domain-containing protein n=1 Tax=Nannocystis exedens TaxID=54 RepID=A0A1I2F3Y3_9BACT|nr:hypothetical protein [Nannocystis exedens]PCC73107.1 hypothetical protein NAEX_06193 [Nannocystis exedens]SFF00124.1 hypothetical protein SAMN02745121_06431 [Nannocystis exedens]